ncbi:MAG: hypothetical protein LPJ89_02340, partial [Hymenobacteraceae bacterium]|nr:hypothetical protein [Hymenobacteraceae bacterium]
KDKDPKELTLEECLDLAEKTPDKPARGGFKKKAAATAEKPAAKKTATKKTAAKKATAKKTASKKSGTK